MHIFKASIFLLLGIITVITAYKRRKIAIQQNVKNLGGYAFCIVLGIAVSIGGVMGIIIKPNSNNNISSHSTVTESQTESISRKKTRTVYSGGYKVEIDLTPPTGYREGATCSDCDGGGVTNHNGTDMICPGCNGKGFHWVK